ncbi:hypothetical protein [Streptomyces sp. NPDC058867]|uniref:hypothetical protein n=1 Tax=unclassified Streptomyces TaxID=2593676 RepID=UPI00368327C6
MESLAPVADTTGVSVSVVEPGAVASEFVSNVGLDDNVPDMGPYAPALSSCPERTRNAFADAQAPMDVARILVDLLATEQPALRVLTSDHARAFAGTKLKDLDGSAVQKMTGAWVSWMSSSDVVSGRTRSGTAGRGHRTYGCARSRRPS